MWCLLLTIRKLCFIQNTKCCCMAVMIHLAYQTQLCVWLRRIHFSMQPCNQLSSLLNEPIKEHSFTHSQGQREIKDGTMSSSVAHLTIKSFWIQFNDNENILVFSYGICATNYSTCNNTWLKYNTLYKKQYIWRKDILT